MTGIERKLVIWLTGLPCSGKTTISKRLADVLPNLSVLDGDEIRKLYSWNDFSKEGIIENNRRVAHLAEQLVNEGRSVCVSLISPYVQCRKDARNIISCPFVEVYLKCQSDVCEDRDVKGLYKKARDGLIKNFIGLDGRYEIPTNPDLIVNTENTSVDDSVQTILDHLRKNKLT